MILCGLHHIESHATCLFRYVHRLERRLRMYLYVFAESKTSTARSRFGLAISQIRIVITIEIMRTYLRWRVLTIVSRGTLGNMPVSCVISVLVGTRRPDVACPPVPVSSWTH